MSDAAIVAMKKANEADSDDFVYVMDEGAAAEPTVTSVRIRRMDNNRTIRAYTSIVIDDELCLNSLAISCQGDTSQYEVMLPTYVPFRRPNMAAMYYDIPDTLFPMFYAAITSAFFAPDKKDNEVSATA